MMTGWLGNELSIDYLNFPFFSEVFELNFFIKSDQTFWIEVDYIPNITIWKGAHYDYFTIIRYKTEKIRKIWFLCSDFFALIIFCALYFSVAYKINEIRSASFVRSAIFECSGARSADKSISLNTLPFFSLNK